MRRKHRTMLARAALTAAVLAAGSGAAAAGPAASFHASRVVEYSPGPGYSLFPDASLALGGPYGTPGGSLHVVSLGVQGHLVLGFHPGEALCDSGGADLIVFENAFPAAGGGTFAELVRVGVSTNGIDYAFFPTRCTVPGPVGPYEGIDPAQVDGFAGVGEVRANVASNAIDPFDPAAAGGDAFDLADLSDDPLVTSSVVDLGRIYYLKLLDVLGDGSEQDTDGRAVYDPTGVMDPPYSQPTSADIDAVSVVHGLPAPIGGDANRDGAVNVLDLGALANHYRLPAGATWEDGDFNGDGAANVLDLGVLANNYRSGGGAPLPEPPVAGILLVLLGGLRRTRAARARRRT